MWAVVHTLSAFALLSFACAQTQYSINKALPTGVTVSTSAGGVFEITPSFGSSRRRLIEQARQSRALLATPFGDAIQFGPPVALGASILVTVGVSAGSVTADVVANITVTAGRKLLASPTPLTFHGEVKKHLTTGAAVGSYLFDASTSAFLSSLAVSGSDASSSFTFLRALIIFPQEGTDSSPPPFAESSTGFVVSGGFEKPIIVRLSTQGSTDYIPNIAIRFDYSQTGTAVGGGPVSPFVSLYYTDYTGVYPSGLPASAASSMSAAINLAQTPGVFSEHM